MEYLTRARAVTDLDDEGTAGLEIRNIAPLLLQDAMQINLDALFSLQIFEDERHKEDLVHADSGRSGQLRG